MKKILTTLKKNAVIFSLSFLLVTSSIITLCIGLGDNKGKNGKNGKDADVNIAENGEVIINGEGTGIFANKGDCEVKVNIDGEEYGRVIGGGKYTSGQTITLQAVPNDDSCFKGWVDKEGAIISLDKNYSFIAEKGKIELTAKFEKSIIEVYFRIAKNYTQYFNNNFEIEINDEIRELKTENDKHYNFFYSLKEPATFEYGEEIIFKFKNFTAPKYKYTHYLEEVDEATYNWISNNKTRIDLDDSLTYNFSINENRKYFFNFQLEVNILVTILPTIDVKANNDEYGEVNKTEISNQGDSVTIKANTKDSGTLDYIYEFKGWYLNGELVSTDKVYTFNAFNSFYEFEAKFVKKYALKVCISTKRDQIILSSYLDPTAYDVVFKNINIYSFNNKGQMFNVSFSGNFNGATIDTSTKICGYFEIGEKIFLSSDIESAHTSYYSISKNGDIEEKEYHEKFVYNRWKLKEDNNETTFAMSSSALFMFNDDMDILNSSINVELFVALYNMYVKD